MEERRWSGVLSHWKVLITNNNTVYFNSKREDFESCHHREMINVSGDVCANYSPVIIEQHTCVEETHGAPELCTIIMCQ